MEDVQYAQDGSIITKDYIPECSCDELIEMLYAGSDMWACIASIFARINHCDCYLHNRGMDD